MPWKGVLTEEDLRTYDANIGLMIEQVRERFAPLYPAELILAALRSVPRHLFVASSYRPLAYTDRALPTLGGLTTSAPSVIAEMIYLASVQPGDRLLEIGAGTGYETAVLSEMGVNVRSIEIDEPLAHEANRILILLGYKPDNCARGVRRKESLARFRTISTRFPRRGTVHLYAGNGRIGLSAHAPYQAIVVAAAVRSLDPLEELISQLSPRGGRLVAPVGDREEQRLRVVERVGARTRVTIAGSGPVVFSPLLL